MFKFLEAAVELSLTGASQAASDLRRIRRLTALTFTQMARLAEAVGRTARAFASVRAIRGFGSALGLVTSRIGLFLATAASLGVAIGGIALVIGSAIVSFRLLAGTLRILARLMDALARVVGRVLNRALNVLVGVMKSLLAPTLAVVRAFTQFRTIVALIAGVALRQLIGALRQARIEIERIGNLFRFVFGPQAGRQLDSIRRIANELGVDIRVAADSFARLQFAGQTAGLRLQETRSLFQGVSSAIVALGLDSEQASRAFRAFEQILQRGTVSAEELRKQLGNAGFPAIELAARSLGITVDDLNKRLDEGSLASVDFVRAFGPELQRTFGSAARAISRFSTTARLARIRNRIFELSVVFGRRLVPATLEFSEALLSVVQSRRIFQFLQGLTDGFARLIEFFARSTAVRNLFDGIATSLAPTIRLLARTVDLVASLVVLLNSSLLAALNALAQVALPFVNRQLERLVGAAGGLFGVTVTGLRSSITLISSLLRQSTLLGQVLLDSFRFAANRLRSILLTLFSLRGVIGTALLQTLEVAVVKAINIAATTLTLVLNKVFDRLGVAGRAALAPVLGIVGTIADVTSDQQQEWNRVTLSWSIIARRLQQSATVLDAAGQGFATQLRRSFDALRTAVQADFTVTSLIDGAKAAAAELRAATPDSLRSAFIDARRAFDNSPLTKTLGSLGNVLLGRTPIGAAATQLNAAAEKVRLSFLSGERVFERLQFQGDDSLVRSQTRNTDAVNRNTNALRQVLRQSGQGGTGVLSIGGQP